MESVRTFYFEWKQRECTECGEQLLGMMDCYFTVCEKCNTLHEE